MLLVVALLLFGGGVLMLLRPGWVWQITEQWKSYGAEEPSPLYRMSVRLGGLLVALAGIAGMIAFYLEKT